MTICLNMIVKNESPVILRCLASVKHLIDYWVIVDTGSTDGTQEKIKSYLSEIPGELHERPWVDFAFNRNEALVLGKDKADYLLFIDADQVLVFTQGSRFSSLKKDCYYVTVHTDFRYSAHYVMLIKSSLSMSWEGVLHEALKSNAKTYSVFTDVHINAFSDGNRSRNPQKYSSDAAILEKALLQEPDNARYMIFLALTYEVDKQPEKALVCFEKRSLMGGWDEEVFYALLKMAHLQRFLEQKPEIFIASYEKAYQKRPTRAEPLYWLADYYMSVHLYEQGYELAKKALQIPLPLKDQIYLEYSVYEYEILLQLVKCAYQTKRYLESYRALVRLQSNKKLPEKIQAQVKDILPHVRERSCS
ncbi:MAG: glycosyltransferase family 2 protein [Chlamydiales bacterium]|nr:glycosyltransferase family 2 protein [Chlamydiales bacterium]